MTRQIKIKRLLFLKIKNKLFFTNLKLSNFDFRNPNKKEGGVKLLDITEQPIGYAAAKKRKKQQEAEDAKKTAGEQQAAKEAAAKQVSTVYFLDKFKNTYNKTR
jgi:hypothetical protein